MFTPEEILEWMEFDPKFFLEYGCEFLSSGKSRFVYRVKYTHFVVKIDRCELNDRDSYCECKAPGTCSHPSRDSQGNVAEWEAYHRMLEDYPQFFRFVTEFYCISECGKYMVAEFLPCKVPDRMNRWANQSRRKFYYEKVTCVFQRIVKSNGVNPDILEDCHSGNFGLRAGSKVPVLLDLGHFW